MHISDAERLSLVAQTAMVGKSAESGGIGLAKLLVEAMEIVQESGKPVRAEHIRMVKRGRDSLQDTVLIKGMVIEQKFDSERVPQIKQASSVLALTCSLTVEQSKRDAEIEIERPEQMLAFLDAEEAILSKKIQALVSSGRRQFSPQNQLMIASNMLVSMKVSCWLE